MRNNATRTVACAAVAWFRLPREIRGKAERGITVNLSSSPSKKTANYYKAIIKVLKSFLGKNTRIETKYTYRVRWCRVPHDCSFIRDKGERLVDAKTKKAIFNLALQSEAVTVKKQAAHQTRQAQKY